MYIAENAGTPCQNKIADKEMLTHSLEEAVFEQIATLLDRKKRLHSVWRFSKMTDTVQMTV